MITVVLIFFFLGLCLGSFVNALVWRLHEGSKTKKPRRELSILRGRSMCPHCKHELAVKDLVPVLSWLWLGGKCRYCHKSISIQYPLVELLTAVLFIFSYLLWSSALQGRTLQQGATLQSQVLFVFWLVFLVGLVALAIYDIKWFLLPDKIIYPLMVLAGLQAIVIIFNASNSLITTGHIALSFIIGGGLFYLLFQISDGRWIGGGDVKLGALLGLIVASPSLSLLIIFVASLLGTLVTLPLLLTRKISRSSHIPFGPFLIAGAIFTRLFGIALITWYKQKFLF